MTANALGLLSPPIDQVPYLIQNISRSNFEALCTGESPNGIHNLHARWYAGVTFNLGNLKVVLAGEVDCQKDCELGLLACEDIVCDLYFLSKRHRAGKRLLRAENEISRFEVSRSISQPRVPNSDNDAL